MTQTVSTTLRGFYPQLGINIAIWLFISLAVSIVVIVIANHNKWFESKKAKKILSEKSIQPKGRVFLQSSLGLLWIVDALLQIQPAMAASFTKQILAPLVSSSQPDVLNLILRWEIYGWQVHPITTDIATALIQMGLGITILAGKNTIFGKIGLWLSIAWSLMIWIGGEAFGGILASGSSEITGWPGAVLFYGIGAIFLLLPYSAWNSGKVTKTIHYCLGSTLILGAFLQGVFQNSFWKSHQLSSLFADMASAPQPSFLSIPITAISHWTANDPVIWNGAFTAIMAVLGIGYLTNKATKKWTLAVALWLLATWWIGQDFGGIFSGTGTDPNLSFPLLLLLITARLAPTTAVASHLVKTHNNQRLSQSHRIRVWPLIGELVGLLAVIVGFIPSVVLAPSWIGKPIALHITPPPPVTGVRIPLATLTAELNVGMLASKGRLQVSLQAPSSNLTPSSSTIFKLSGHLKAPGGNVKTLSWLGCGQGCFISSVNWKKGISHLFLHASASGWKGGNANFNIGWPAHPNNVILPKVVKAMQKVKSFNLTQIDTSDTSFGSFKAVNRLSGTQVLNDEPYHLGSSIHHVVVLRKSATNTQIAFGNIAQGTFVRLNISKNNRITSEQLVQPQQLTFGYFNYAK